ncbi:MAG: hypothetical protein PHI24_09070 [Desulfitobacteriaceae bacterium]|nr:hypothetical protein [Desulfitobacteriaceae bacterium]
MSLLVAPKLFSVPEHLASFSLGEFFDLEFDDPFIKVYPTDTDYKVIGEKKEMEIAMRCEENGFLTVKQDFGESKDLDRFLISAGNSSITIPIQIRGATYNKEVDIFTVDTTCTKRGNKKAALDASRVKFVLVWMPFTFKDTFTRRRGVYIIPINIVNMFKRHITLFPHRDPSNNSKGNMKIKDFNNYFEAWYLLEEYRDTIVTC